jgi:ketosteroid isomerase-like protein
MRILVLSALIVLSPVGAFAQTDSTSAELQALHAQWFKAFDAGDGQAMDQMEVPNLVLIMPNGMVWTKDAPRAGTQQKHDPMPQRTVTDVIVRRFGETAVLTGTVTTTVGGDVDKAATTVVFVRSSGNWHVASAQWTPAESRK